MISIRLNDLERADGRHITDIEILQAFHASQRRVSDGFQPIAVQVEVAQSRAGRPRRFGHLCQAAVADVELFHLSETLEEIRRHRRNPATKIPIVQLVKAQSVFHSISRFDVANQGWSLIL